MSVAKTNDAKESFQQLVTTYGEWAYRLAVMLAFGAILWLNQHYVTKEDFSSDIQSLKNDVSASQQQINLRIDSIVSGLNLITTGLAVAQQRQQELEDVKMRLRELEKERRKSP
jgi:4-amino-4-deoxy-L-arabinose transferase-like glycosyltransferase